MKRLLFAAVISFSFTMISCAQPKVAETADTSTASKNVAIEEEILRLINQYRKTKGLAALRMNVIISEEAKKHSANMAASIVPFGHEGFETRARTLVAQIKNMRGAAENVATGQRNAAQAVEDWIKSPGHKANIEGNYTETGIGVVANKKGVLYYTQIFIR